MIDFSTSDECHFVFSSDSNEEESYDDEKYVKPSNEQEDETMNLFNLLNQKENEQNIENIDDSASFEEQTIQQIDNLSLNNNETVQQKSTLPINGDENNEANNEISKEKTLSEAVDSIINMNLAAFEKIAQQLKENYAAQRNAQENHDFQVQESSKQKKKKKKVKPKEIPQRLLVTRNELNKNFEKEEEVVTKKKSKKAIQAMINRLMNQPKPKIENENENVKVRVQTDPQIFDRLYQMSQEKEERNKKLRKEYEEEEINLPERKAEKTNKKSNALAEQQLVSFINSTVPEVEEMNENELTALFEKLGILDHKEQLAKNQATKKVYEEWMSEKEDGQKVFLVSRVKEALIKCSTQNNFSQFDRYARQRMIIALSDLKQKSRNVQVEEPKIDKKISKETILRLSKAKDNPPPKRQVKETKPKPKPKPKEEIEKMSVKTQEILENCDLARITFEERNKIILEKRNERIKKLDEELHSEKLDVSPTFGQKPHWSNEVQEKLDEFRKKKLNKKSDEPSYRPNIISFKKYQKQIRKQMMAEVNLPEGYEESINRHRQAYSKFIQKKMEEAKRDPFYDIDNVPL